MRTPLDRVNRRTLSLICTTKKRLPDKAKQPEAPNWPVAGCTLVLLFLIGFYTGHFSGASAVPMAATVVPLLFGLLTVVLLNDVTWNKIIAVFIFTAAFSQGHRIGQHVDEPHDVQLMLDIRNQRVSDDIYEQLTLLDLQLSHLKLDGTRHNAVLYGVGARIIEDAKLSEADKVAAIKSYRDDLQKIGR
jgi:hypothetical protein